MQDKSANMYCMPEGFRRMENLHILFWLFKDISWCMLWKPLGIAMIFPTLVVAIILSYRTRHLISELCHNLAIVCWIFANSYWMIAEFYSFDEMVIFNSITYKHLAVIPFVLGMLILAYYYLYRRKLQPGVQVIDNSEVLGQAV